jgi:hypothetical protein
MKYQYSNYILPILVLLVIVSSLAGLLVEGTYTENTIYMVVKSKVLDLVLLLLVVPVCAVGYAFLIRRKLWAQITMSGVVAYLLFFVGFNTFSLSLNNMFLVYVAIIGFGTFAAVDLVRAALGIVTGPIDFSSRKAISLSLIFVAVSGTGFWLNDTIPALINETAPESIANLGIAVNPACAFDLAFMIPLMVMGAVQLWKRRGNGYIISGIILNWLVLTAITVIAMELGLAKNGLEYDVGNIIAFTVEGALGIAMLVILYRNLSTACSSGQKF